MVVDAENEVKTIVLVGRTGNGLSATGNSIIGRKVFDSMPSSAAVTSLCQLKRTVLEDGRILNVIDTPGLFDSAVEPLTVGKEIAKCINMAKDGIHAFILVLSVRSRFSREEAAAVEILRQFFGGRIGDYLIVVFTGGDALGQTCLDDYLACNLPEYLERTLKWCGDRCVLFDNMTEDEGKKSQQVKKLISLVDTVVENNGGIPYTNELFAELKMSELTLHHQTTVVDSRTSGIEMFNNSREDQLKAPLFEQKRVVKPLDQAVQVNSVEEYSEHQLCEVKEQFNKRNEDQLNRITVMVESKLREIIHRLGKQLAEEKAAQPKAEAAAETTHKLKKQLAEEQAARLKAEDAVHKLEKQLVEEYTARLKAEAEAVKKRRLMAQLAYEWNAQGK